MQGALRRGANYGQAQLRPSELQKSKLIDQALALLLCLFPSPIGCSHHVHLARELRFGYVPGPACLSGLVEPSLSWMAKPSSDDYSPFQSQPLRLV
jgi:hypothetical protein